MRWVDRQTVQSILDMNEYAERQQGSVDACIESQPAPPCDDCRHSGLCALNNMACKAFFAYTREPNGGIDYIDWATLERKPSIAIFNRMMTK